MAWGATDAEATEGDKRRGTCNTQSTLLCLGLLVLYILMGFFWAESGASALCPLCPILCLPAIPTTCDGLRC